jgi:hypothetical protein
VVFDTYKYVTATCIKGPRPTQTDFGCRGPVTSPDRYSNADATREPMQLSNGAGQTHLASRVSVQNGIRWNSKVAGWE